MADVTLNRGNTVFNQREKKKKIDCLLNQGGIRSTLPKGNVTSRTASQNHAFENSLVVFKGEQINEIVDYFIKENNHIHYLVSLSLLIKNNHPKKILVQGNL
jgi:2',3'-cyclic-nucleotide 2'-phosphodiesterase (5'-nucleotidase family)